MKLMMYTVTTFLFAAVALFHVPGHAFTTTTTGTNNFVSSSSSWLLHQDTTKLYSTWSNGQAVQDYKEFLNSGKQEMPVSEDIPSVMIYSDSGLGGSGFYPTLGQLLYAARSNQEYEDIVLNVQQIYDYELPADIYGNTEYPIYILLPPQQLMQFISNLPPSYLDRVNDFVFFSGGFQFGNIEDVLKERGLCRDAMTQVLVSGMKVTPNELIDQRVVFGVDSYGEDKVAGECTACGKWSGSIIKRLNNANVFCRMEFYREWRRKMWERTLFDAIYNLIGIVRTEPTTLSNVGTYYSEEISNIIWEMSQLLRGWKAITLTYGFEERLNAIAEFTGQEQPCMIFDEMFPYIWGLPVFLESNAYLEYLHYAQNEMNSLGSIALPPQKREYDEDYTSSNMRKGVLRADGVI